MASGLKPAFFLCRKLLYPVNIPMHPEIDDDFMQVLSALAGSGIEMAFERRGSGTSTYPLHGEVVAVDETAGTIQIRRTRTNAGEVQTMGLRHFLSATAPHCEPLTNTLAGARLQADQQKDIARERAIEQVKANTGSGERPALSQSRFQGTIAATIDGVPSNRYVYSDKVDPTRTVGIVARSMADATQFMASQDLFMTLDDSLQIAVVGHVLWPAGIAYDTLHNPDAWRAPWPEIFKSFDGLPAIAMAFYLRKARRGSWSVTDPEAIGIAAIQSLSSRGLLHIEGHPTDPAETIKRIPVSGLKALLRIAGAKPKLQTRVHLEEQVLAVMTSELHQRAHALMKAPKAVLKAPCGLSNEEFAQALNEMRDLIFTMRQWLRSTFELEREDDLRRLSTRT